MSDQERRPQEAPEEQASAHEDPVSGEDNAGVWATAGEKILEVHDAVVGGAETLGRGVKRAVLPDGPLRNQQRRWDELMALEDRLIRIGHNESTGPPRQKANPDAGSSGWSRFGRALLRVLGFPFRILLLIFRLLGMTLRLSGDLWRKLSQLWSERSVEDSEAEGEPQRFPAWRNDGDAPDRVGLALSGGGIRSATFNLGMLQKLDELKLLRGFDYLATVSGGGYIGGFWSAWLHRQAGQNSEGPFPRAKEGEPEPRSVRHLREFSNFLRPRLDLFSFSTGRILAGLVAGILPSILVALTVIAFALGTWTGFAWLLLSERPLGPFEAPLGPASTSAVFLLIGTLAPHLVVELMWLGRPEDSVSRARLTYWFWAITSSVVAAGTWWLLWHVAPLPYSFIFRPLGEGATRGSQLALAFFPLLAWGAALVFLIVVRVASSAYVDNYQDRARRAALGRALSRVIFCLALWSIAATVWVGGQWLAAVGITGVVAAISTALAGGGTFAWLRGLLSAEPNKPAGSSGFVAKLKPVLPKVIATVTLGAAAAATASIVILAYQNVGHTGPARFFILVAVLALLACILFEPHENGFHALYRERLARAYLGASNEDPSALPYATEVREHDDIRMDTLTLRPLHLICCAANDLGADGLRTLHRGAESAVLSLVGLQVGDVWRRWKTPSHPGAAVPYLSQAMTASAAAFNSHMGGISMRLGRSATFLLAALGLRLGLWVEGPVAAQQRWRQRWAVLQRLFPGLLFFRELLGASHSRAGWVHLSDGAHFENLALYELIRRHCRYILISDCGADPDVAFDDFGNAVRRVREDFGVEIDIDLAALRPRKEGGGSRQPVVAGDICYPGGDKGILLYVKPTLIGDEPEDITQYARRNQDFPHETTLDQFYDEAQWEAYRRLGGHVIEKAIEGLSEKIACPSAARTRERLVRIFFEARLAWPPSKIEDASVLVSLDREWTALEKTVAATASPLRDELFPGLAPSAAGWTSESLGEHLPHVQEALRLMAAAFLNSGIGAKAKSGSHPRYQGWLNRFGRWTGSYAFRAWWPWLIPIHDRSFAEFMGGEFDLPVSKKHETARIERVYRASPLSPELDPWLLVEQRPKPPFETYVYSDLLGPAKASLVVAVAVFRVEDGSALLRPKAFRVPAGMWSLGIGETFLDLLIEHFELRPDIHEIRIAYPEHSTRTFSAEISALYVGAGFKRDFNGFIRAVPGPAKADDDGGPG